MKKTNAQGLSMILDRITEFNIHLHNHVSKVTYYFTTIFAYLWYIVSKMSVYWYVGRSDSSREVQPGIQE